MKGKGYIRTLLLTVIMVFLFASSPRAGIYINSVPDEIRITEGEPLYMPVFISPESLSGKTIELSVWMEDMESLAIKYLSETGWISSSDKQGIKPLLSYGPMPEYINLLWQAFSNTTGMRSFIIHICIDGTLDGMLSQDGICGTHNIYIDPPSPSQPGECKGLVIDPSTTSYSTELKRGEEKQYNINVKDSCGNDIEFNAESTVSWITLTKTKGRLTINVNSSTLSPNKYNGKVTIASLDGSSNTNININLTVNAPSFDIGGGCNPSYLSISPVYITATSGETKTQSISITNNCGNPVSYTASVTQGSNWLSASTSGSGTMNITVNTKDLSAGQHIGNIKVTSGSLSANVSVQLEVTGPCSPSYAQITPSSISKTVTKGGTASETLSIKDNCGTDISFKVSGITYEGNTSGWITYTTGSGTLNVKLDAANLNAGSYKASIPLNLTLTGNNIQGVVEVTMTVTDVSAPPPTDSLTKLTDNTRWRFKLGSKQVRYFYFETASLDPKDTDKYYHQLTYEDVLEVRLEPYANAYYGGDILVRYAGRTCDGKLPTLDELLEIRKLWKSGEISNQPRWLSWKKTWQPARWRDDLYYDLKDSPFELPTIGGDPNYPLGCYYILVYNDDPLNQGTTDLYVSFAEYAARYHGPGYQNPDIPR